MIKDIFSKDDIRLNVEASDWRVVIKKAGEVLLDSNKITEGYINAMIEAVEAFGPYIVIMPGIAFAHARPSESVKEDCLGLITLKDEIEFGSEENDPVHTVFVFGSTSTEGHLNALAELVGFLDKEEHIEMLKNCTDSDLLYKTICK